MTGTRRSENDFIPSDIFYSNLKNEFCLSFSVLFFEYWSLERSSIKSIDAISKSGNYPEVKNHSIIKITTGFDAMVFCSDFFSVDGCLIWLP